VLVKKSVFRSALLGVVPLFVLAHLSHHLLAAILTPLMPFIRDEFALDYTRAGGLLSAFTLSYGISQLPAGWLADRLGRRVLITLGISGVALFSFLAGLSTGYLMMAAFLVVAGIMGGGYHPAASPLVSASVEPKNRGRALGFHQIGGSASFFLAPMITVAIATALGWRGSFISLSIPIFIFGVVLYILLGRLGYTEKSKQKMASSGPEAVSASPLHRLIALITLGITIQVLVFSTISFIPLFIVDHFGASKEVAAVLLALVYSAGIWAGPLGGYLSDRLGKVPVMLTVGLLAGPILFLLNLAPFGWALSLVLIIVGITMFSTMPVSEAYIIARTSERRRSTVLGIYYFASRGGPGVITPVLGYLIDQFGFNTGFAVMGGSLFVVAIICSLFFLKRGGTLNN